MQIRTIFPTLLLVKDLSLDSTELHRLRSIIEREVQKRESSSCGAMFRQTGSALHELSELASLVDMLVDASEEYFGLLSSSAELYPYIHSCWATISKPGDYQASHIHANSALSGVLYIHAPSDCGDLVFRDPRIASRMMDLGNYLDNDIANRTVSFSPRPGALVIFPSWLEHSVEVNRAKESRVSIAFNVWPRGTIGSDARFSRITS